MMAKQTRGLALLRLPRFSLRTGLVLFLVVGTGLGLAARWIQDVQQRGEAQKWLVAQTKTRRPNRGSPIDVHYAAEQGKSWGTELVRQWVHPEYERRIGALNINGRKLNDEAVGNIARVFDVESIVIHSDVSANLLAHVAQAPGLRKLCLYGGVSNRGISFDPQYMKPARQLESIEVNAYQPIDDALVRWLCEAPELKRIWMHQVPRTEGEPCNLVEYAKTPGLAEFSVVFSMTSHEAPERGAITPAWSAMLAKMFAELSQRKDLNRLRLFSVELSDPALLTRFCEISNIRYLHMEGCLVTPECLREIAKLKKIETLHLHWTPLKSEHLEILATMKTLRGVHALRCDSSDVTNESLSRLKAALPRCKITRYLQ